MKAFHAFFPDQVLDFSGTDPELGLSSVEAAFRLRKNGPNRLESKPVANPFRILLRQFLNPMAYLLLIAVGVSIGFREYLDASAIFGVILINAAIGFFMELQANRSMEALKRMATVQAQVIRDGKRLRISSDEVVVGDLLLVETGDMVTADARLIREEQLETNEAYLTGESLPSIKQTGPLSVETPLAEQYNQIFKGTFVTRGNGLAVVTATGMATEVGKIASMVQEAKEQATPLNLKLNKLANLLIYVTLGLVVIIFISGIVNGRPWQLMLETAIALAVAAIPEGLPIVATLALARGALKMAQKEVIIKRLASVETLGGTSVICSDKTGTLTLNQIEVSLIEAVVDLPKAFETGGKFNFPSPLEIGVLCNTAAFYPEEKKETGMGDPLEVALLKYAYHKGWEPGALRMRYPILSEEPFSSETRVMATLHSLEDGRYLVAAKGGFESIFKLCIGFSPEKQIYWTRKAEGLAAQGLRILAFAFKSKPEKPDEMLSELTFSGIIGFIDPPAKGVAEAIAQCQSAGIRVVMITGDHPATAANIAVRLGMASNESISVIRGQEMAELSKLSSDEKERWLSTPVFARVSPGQKLDIIQLMQENHLIVGMTGDGVNDAPALKKADIGIAMGLRGTQVAQEAADMILRNDSFASIVEAVRQGRVIFDNIRKFVVYLLSCNISELILIGISAILNLHFVLFPLQILFINLVTDVLPALALGFSGGDHEIMKRKPRNPSENIIGKKDWWNILAYSLILSLTVLGIERIPHLWEGWGHVSDLSCNNLVFYSLLFAQVFHVFNMTTNRNFFSNEITRNRHVWLALGTCLFVLTGCVLLEPVRLALHLGEPALRDLLIAAGTGLFSALLVRFYAVTIQKLL